MARESGGTGLPSYVRTTLVCLLGVLGFLLAGATASPAGMAARGIAAGCVAGLAFRGRSEFAAAGFAGLAASLAGAAASLGILTTTGIGFDGSPVVGTAVAALAGLATALTLSALGRRAAEPVVVWAGFALVLIVFLSTIGVLPGQNEQGRSANIRRQVSIELSADSGQADTRIYRKTHFAMERGVGYYEAWAQAFSEEGGSRPRPANMFQYRPPALFLLWRVLPGPVGVRLWWWFALLAVVGMAFGYATALRLVGPAAAVLVPIGLSAYFAMPLMTLYFLLSEFWGVIAALVFLYLLVSDRPISAAFALTAAVAVRELFAYLLPVYVLWWYLSPRRRDRRRVAGVAMAVGLPVLVTAVHATLSRGTGATDTGLATWLNGGLDALARSLRYSGDLAIGSSVLYLVLPVAALAGVLMVPKKEIRIALAAAVALPLAALAAFSGGEAWAYWGAIAGPVLLTLWPVLAARMFPPAGGGRGMPDSSRARKA